MHINRKERVNAKWIMDSVLFAKRQSMDFINDHKENQDNPKMQRMMQKSTRNPQKRGENGQREWS